MHICVKMMSNGSKEALTVLIVTHVTQVKRVESGVCGFYATLHTEYFTQFVTHVERVESVPTHTLSFNVCSCVFTTRKRNLGQGNVFTTAYQSFS